MSKEYRAVHVSYNRFVVNEITWEGDHVASRVLLDDLEPKKARKLAGMLNNAYKAGKAAQKAEIARRLR